MLHDLREPSRLARHDRDASHTCLRRHEPERLRPERRDDGCPGDGELALDLRWVEPAAEDDRVSDAERTPELFEPGSLVTVSDEPKLRRRSRVAEPGEGAEERRDAFLAAQAADVHEQRMVGRCSRKRRRRRRGWQRQRLGVDARFRERTFASHELHANTR